MKLGLVLLLSTLRESAADRTTHDRSRTWQERPAKISELWWVNLPSGSIREETI
jgi:hypothetical protein